MKYEIVYEIPPFRAIYRTEIEADNTRDAEEKIREVAGPPFYRIKEINKIEG